MTETSGTAAQAETTVKTHYELQWQRTDRGVARWQSLPIEGIRRATLEQARYAKMDAETRSPGHAFRIVKVTTAIEVV